MAASERRLHERACDQLGVYFPPNHLGRRAALTHALRRTKENACHHDIDTIRKLAGHTDRKTTETYIDQDVIDVGHVLRMPTARKRPIHPPHQKNQ